MQVTACTAGETYAINVYSGTNIESQVIFSISTGCWAACAGNTTLSSISAVTGADDSGDTAYASQAGIPLPTNYTPVAAVATDPMNTNPCLGQDAGYYNGMTSTFFADVYPADSTSKDDFPLDFSGTGNVTRYSSLEQTAHCSCHMLLFDTECLIIFVPMTMMLGGSQACFHSPNAIVQ